MLDISDFFLYLKRENLTYKKELTEETCSFIKKHPEIINKRVKTVMLRDLKDIKEYYKESDIDYQFFKSLKSWLENFEVEE